MDLNIQNNLRLNTIDQKDQLPIIYRTGRNQSRAKQIINQSLKVASRNLLNENLYIAGVGNKEKYETYNL